MLTSLLSLLGFIPNVLSTIDGITAAISNEKIAALTATTQQEQIASAERIAALQARRDALIAAEAQPATGWVRSLIVLVGAAPVLFKFSWDKVVGPFFGCVGHTDPGTCGIFTTDPIDPHQWYVIGAVIAFYFAADAYGKR
jgi:hypothetical protein